MKYAQNKKRLLWPVAALLLVVVVLMAGCGNSTAAGTSAPASGTGQTAGNGTAQNAGQKTMDASTVKLFGTLRRVEGLVKDKNYPLTADQAKKLLPIVKDIAAQKTIAADYATEKQKEIIAVLSPEQQKVISTPPQRPARATGGKRNAGNRSGSPNNGIGRANFQNGFLERVISVLQQKAGG